MSFGFQTSGSNGLANFSNGFGGGGSDSNNPKEINIMDETFDFIDSNDEEDEEDVDEPEVDPVSNVLLTRFEDAPIPKDGVEQWTKTSRVLKFKLNPNGVNSIGFISQDPHSAKKIKVFPEETRVYTTPIPTLNDSELYTDYVSNLFSIYEALGDEKYYSVPTIGLIKRDAQRQQTEVLNKAASLIVKELEIYIERKQQANESETQIFELEESLNIINCLRALYFTESYEIPQFITEWINKADPQPDIELTESVMNYEKPYTHPYFWKFIIQLTLRGLYQNAAQALYNSGFEELQSTDSNIYNLLQDSINLLQSYPENSPLEVFKSWKSTTAKAANNASIRNPDHPELTKNIKALLSILAGNKTSILENSTSWYESLVGLFHYHIPSVELLQEYYQLSIQHHQPDRSSIWELASLDIFEGNFLQVLRAISSFDPATTAYIAALCEARGLLKGYSFEDNSKSLPQLDQDLFSPANVSQYLLHTHALDCLSIEKLIPVGIGILVSSKNPTGRSVVAEYLPRYNFKTNDDIEWALTICASLKLPQIAHVIFRTAAQRSLSQGLLLESLTLFARAGEIDFVKHHSWLIFENSLLRGAPIDDVIINAVVDDSIVVNGIEPESLKVQPALRQTLAPYAILYRFWKLKEAGSLREALTKLVALLKFPYLPAKLFGVLTSQILPFVAFNTPSNILQQKDLLTLIKIIDKYEAEILSPQDKKSLKLKEQAEELYKYFIAKDDDNNWVKQLKQVHVDAPQDLDTLIRLIRRSLAVEIGRSFMEEIYV